MTSTMRRMLAASLLLAVAGCAGSPVIVAAPSACTELIPADWAKGIQHTDIPAPAPDQPKPGPAGQDASYWHAMYDWALGEAKKWTGFGVSEANKVDQANGRTADAIGITGRCEARDAAAVKKAKPKVLGVF